MVDIVQEKKSISYQSPLTASADLYVSSARITIRNAPSSQVSSDCDIAASVDLSDVWYAPVTMLLHFVVLFRYRHHIEF